MQILLVAVQYCLPHHLLSRLAGRLMNSRHPWLKNGLIRWFIKRYNVDMTQAQIQDIDQFETFNAFFSRRLLPGARKIADGSSIIAPADGVISQIGELKCGNMVQAKKKTFKLIDLFAGREDLARTFRGGQFATIYLSPRDYHRVHMPLSGQLKEMVYVPGRAFSVNALTTRHVPRLFARNERAICLFETQETGPMAVILVGAMLVASIHTAWQGQVTPAPKKVIKSWRYQDKKVFLNKGDELGHFCLGSTVILLFPRGKMAWDNGVERNNAIHFGEKLAEIVKET